MNHEPLLLLTIEPRTDENLVGYVLRLTERNAYDTPSWLTRAAGLRKLLVYNCPFIFDESLELSGLARLAGQDVARLRPLLYPPVDPAKPLSDSYLFGAPVSRFMIVMARPKICPDCLRETGYVHRVWDFVPVTACPVHRRVLRDECHGCGKRVSWVRNRVAFCGGCGADWREAPTTEASEADLRVSREIYRLCGLALPDGPGLPPASPLSGLDLKSFVSALTFVAAQFHGIANTNGKFIVATRRNAEVHDLYKRAYEVFEEWPKNFNAFMAWRSSHSRNPESPEKLRQDIRVLYTRLPTLLPGPGLEFLRRAFGEYLEDPTGAPRVADISNQFERRRLWGKRRMTVGGKSYVSKAAAMQMLGIHHRLMKSLVEAGHLKLTVVSGEEFSRPVVMVELDSVNEFKEKYGELICLEEARALLGLAGPRVKALSRAGGPAPLTGPADGTPVWKFGRGEVERLLNALKAAAKGGPRPEGLMDFTKAWRVFSRAGKGIEDLLGAASGGALDVYLSPEGLGLHQFEFDPTQVRRYVAEANRAMMPADTLLVDDVAEALGVSDTAVKGLVKSGFLAARIVRFKRGRCMLITRQSLDDLRARYALATHVGAGVGRSGVAVVRALELKGVAALHGGCLTLYRRADLEGVDLGAALAAYDEARRAPCKNPNLVDAEAACELLGVNPGDLEDMVRRRIVCPFDRGQAPANGLLFRSEMLVRLRNSAREWKLDLRDLREYVNADEAAELMGVSVDHFRKRYVNTGRVSFRLRDIGYREGLFSKKEVQALAEEVASFASRVVGINEAREILGLGATTVHRLVDGGHLKPVVGPSVDGFGRVKFLREDVEVLARQRAGQMSLLGV